MQHKSPKFKILIIAAVAVIIVLAVLLGGMMLWKKQMGDATVKKDQYQAIFLTNGQVYFGKISGINDRYIHLNKIFYLQVQSNSKELQPADNKDGQNNQQISLAKLGEELHGPEDSMYIARDQVLFWENLKDNGKVVQAIKQSGK